MESLLRNRKLWVGIVGMALLVALGVMHVGLYVLLVAGWRSFYAAASLLARLLSDIAALLRGDC